MIRPAVPRFELFPSLGVQVGDNPAPFSGRMSVVGTPWKTFMNVELPVDPVRLVVVVEDKRCEFGRGFDRREDLAIWWKDSSGWSVRGVGGAGYISGVQLAAVSIQKDVDSL